MNLLSQRQQIDALSYSYYISFRDMQSFFEFLASVINRYPIDWLYLFWDIFEWFYLHISSDAKCPHPYPRHCVQRSIVSNLKQKRNTALLLVVLFAVAWVPCILRHPICTYTEWAVIIGQSYRSVWYGDTLYTRDCIFVTFIDLSYYCSLNLYIYFCLSPPLSLSLYIYIYILVFVFL